MLDQWSFERAPKIGDGSHRVTCAADTLARARVHAPAVPITRVSDLTPLDRARLPIYSATTPLARDLTTHLGKGFDQTAAQVSAMMEAVERVSAERVESSARRMSFRQMSEEVLAVDPCRFDLPDESSYSEDLPISWVEAWDLLQRRPVWIPVDLAITPPAEGVLREVDTNGLAAGNTLLEAVVHAICELIERDALGTLLFQAAYADAEDRVLEPVTIDPDSLPHTCRALIERVSRAQLGCQIESLHSDVGVAVFRAVLIEHTDREDGHPRRFIGLGASPDASIAVTRSVTEAVQSRMAVIQGARDSFNAFSSPWRRTGVATHLRDFEARDSTSFSTIPTFETTDLLEDLRYLLRRLNDAGFDEVIGVDLSRANHGFPVVRIRVPGLTSFAVNRRRPGWRCLRYLL